LQIKRTRQIFRVLFLYCGFVGGGGVVPPGPLGVAVPGAGLFVFDPGNPPKPLPEPKLLAGVDPTPPPSSAAFAFICSMRGS
jgi:hypothetical protein